MKLKGKLSLLICSFLLVLTGFFFVGCNEIDYSKMSLVASVNGQDVTNYTVGIGDTLPIIYRIEGYQDGMNDLLEINVTGDNCITYSPPAANGKGVYTVIVTASSGGIVHMFASIGQLQHDFKITVSEYSDTLTNNEQKLYVTESVSLTPDSSNFVFGKSNIQKLDYYFYGIASSEDRDLTLDDVKDSYGELFQKFTKVFLHHQNRDLNYYLIFEDETGKQYTLQNTVYDEYINTKIVLISASKNSDGDYTFSGDAKTVDLGDRFTFVAVYPNDREKEIFVARDFYVLRDFDLQGKVEYKYSFKTEDVQSAEYVNRDIVLVPNRTDPLNLQAATFEVSIPTESKLIDMSYSIPAVNGIDIVLATQKPTVRADGKTTYTLVLSNNCNYSAQSSLDITFFYAGFEDAVSYKLSIPLKVLYEPKVISVNGDMDEKTGYTFYNQYEDSFAGGWQQFDVKYTPNELDEEGRPISNISAVDSLEIIFNPEHLMLRVKNQRYTSGAVTIYDLSSPIEFRGVNGAPKQENFANYITLKLHYTLLEENIKEYHINYNIDQGASYITASAENQDYIRNAVYVALGRSAVFTGLYADAPFKSVNAYAKSQREGGDLLTIQGMGMAEGGTDGMYPIAFSITGNRASADDRDWQTYRIELDNGVYIDINFVVIESLDSVNATLESGDAVTYFSTAVQEDSSSASVYIANSNSANGVIFDGTANLLITANGLDHSSAIKDVKPLDKTGAGFTYKFAVVNDGDLRVELATNALSYGTIKISILGWEVTEDFKLDKSREIEYSINVVSYSFVEDLNIIKLHDGKGDYNEKDALIATNLTVYYGTNVNAKRTATVTIKPKYEGYLFLDPLSDKANLVTDATNYENSPFDFRFVTWTASLPIIDELTGRYVDFMVYNPSSSASNNYTIEGVGTFNTKTFEFVSLNSNFASDPVVTLTATVRQFGKRISVSKSVDITLTKYNDVTSISLQNKEESDSLTFSVDKQSADIILYTSPVDATDPALGVIFEAPSVKDKNGDVVPAEFFGGSEKINELIKMSPSTDGVWAVSITIDPDFIRSPLLSLEDANFTGTLRFGSKSWMSGNTFDEAYLDYCVSVEVRFATGSKASPYLLDSPQSVLNINKRPDRHYIISSTIDLGRLDQALLNENLPIGKNDGGFSGSIIGTNEYAAIIGINITENTSSTAGYYGLFSSLTETAEINGVKFAGSINISLSVDEGRDAHIGLVAGINNGLLVNLGVSFDKESKINILSASSESSIYVGGVVGRNLGVIIQDYEKFLDRESKIPNILFFSKDYSLTISSATQTMTNLYVGAVTGYNLPAIQSGTSVAKKVNYQYDDENVLAFDAGSIIKIDEQSLQLFGYSNYIAYLDIFISGNVKNYAGLVAGKSSGGIYAIRRINLDSFDNKIEYYTVNPKVISPDSILQEETEYKAGQGIVVGGSISDQSLIDNSNAMRDEFVQYIGGVVGYIDGIDYNYFTGITARANVLGTKYVGAVAGFIDVALNDDTKTPCFVVQATDGGKTGLYSAMVARVFVGINAGFVSSASEFNTRYLSTEMQYIAFGGFSDKYGVSVFTKDGINVFNYVKRQKTPSITNSGDVDYYFGNFVVSRGLNVLSDGSNPLEYATGQMQEQTPIYASLPSLQFASDSTQTSLSVSASEYFAPFLTLEGKPTDQLFYMYLFRSAGFVYQEDDDQDALSQSQQYLNERYNVVYPGARYYPLKLHDGIVLSSSSNILDIDQSGRISAFNTGYANVQISSILDTNSKIEFYIYVVDYFNAEIGQEKQSSIIYPTLSSSSTPIDDGTVIQIKGDSTVNRYIIPKTDTDNEVLKIENGVLIDNGANIKLQQNELLSAHLTIYNGDTVVYDNLNPVLNPQLDVTISGQTITIAHNAQTKENYGENAVTYRMEASGILLGQISKNNITTQYVCQVNKKLTDVEIAYTKGARKIYNLNYDEVPLFTSGEANDEISILSSWAPQEMINGKYQEENPDYVILRGANAIYSSYEGLVDENIEDQVLLVEFGTMTYSPYKEGDDNSLYLYKVPITIKFNPNCKAYDQRFDKDMYGKYLIVFYAKSDPSKQVQISVNLQRTTVKRVSIDNYSDWETMDSFSATSSVGIPGKHGLLAITLTPTDGDFDHITIENDAICDVAGNGKANFSLVARDLASLQNNLISFNKTNISGKPTARGVQFAMADIERSYDGTINEEFKGVVYIEYTIGTSGVSGDGVSRFNVMVGSGEEKPPVYYIDLTLKVDFHAYADLVDKEVYQPGYDDIHAIYRVAKGLRYEIALNDIWGYTPQDVTFDTSNHELATIVQENGKNYVQITTNDITTFGSNGYASVQLIAHAVQHVGEIDRDERFITQLQVLDYVVNYNYNQIGNADIISNMEDNVIDVRIGHAVNFDIDLTNFIEFNDADEKVVYQVQNFMRDLTQNGDWTLYTNLYDNGESTNQVVSPDKYQTKVEEFNKQQSFNNVYLFVNGTSVVPRKTHNPSTPFYMFEYDAEFDVYNGGYRVQEGGNKVHTQFALNVYQQTSEATPIPVDSYQNLVENIKDGANLILINDIVVPNSDDEQIVSAIDASNLASLDGNDYKFYFNGKYDFGAATNMALFSQVGSDTLLKNITIELAGNVVFTNSNEGTFDAALLASTNSGTITNCEVISGTDPITLQRYTFNATSTNSRNQSYVVGLVSRNSGVITHCRSSVCIKTTYNASGLVGENSGHIASSYFMGGRIEVASPEHNLAGLVVTNHEGAKILTSYVSGNVTSRYIFSQDAENILYSGSSEAGFVFTNDGEISDCYSNIQIKGGAPGAGFVFDNSGRIQNCFSLSVLENYSQTSSGFVMNNYEGTFENCYYFINKKGEKGSYEDLDNINIDPVPKNIAGIQQLNKDAFQKGGDEQEIDEAAESKDFDSVFASYAYYDLSTTNASAVWFYSRENSSSEIFDYQEFAGGRLELVAANIKAKSRRNLAPERTTVDSQTDEVIYQYDDDTAYPQPGTIKNPYLIRTADEFESYMQEGATQSGYNNKNYRIINNLNYGLYASPSHMYNIIYCGVLEGNGLSINNIQLNSSAKMQSAGMFAQIGRNVTNIGVVMNLNITLSNNITFNNTEVVGTLAGKVNNGYLFNIKVSSDDEDAGTTNTVSIAGANFVGGVIGLAQGNYKMFNIQSNLSAISNYKSREEDIEYSFEDNTNLINQYSYAGALVGYASGRGEISNCVANEIETVLAARVGLAFGGIGQNVSVHNVEIDLNTQTSIKSHKFAGFLTGENRGNLDVIVIQNVAAETFMPFDLRSGIPEAVGGIAGYMQGGTISRVDLQQGFTIGRVYSSGSNESISFVGGVVGLVDKQMPTFKQIVIEGSINGTYVVGGVVGQNNVSVTMEEIAVKGQLLSVTGETNMSYIGGFIGCSTNAGSQITIKDSYISSNILVDCYVYATVNQTFAGPFLGSGTVYSMERCYNSGNMSVTLEDKLSGQSTQTLDGNETDGMKNLLINPASQSNGVDNTSITDEKSKIKDVYFFGSSNKTPNELLKNGLTLKDGQGNSALTYRSNASRINTDFHYNIIGLGTYEYESSEGVDTVDFNEQVLYNLFDYYTLLNVKKDDGASSVQQVSVNREIYYNAQNDRYYFVGHGRGILDGTQYFYHDETDNAYYSNVGRNVAENKKGTYSFFASDLGAVNKDDYGHAQTSSVWDLFKNDFSTLKFEKMISMWR